MLNTHSELHRQGLMPDRPYLFREHCAAPRPTAVEEEAFVAERRGGT